MIRLLQLVGFLVAVGVATGCVPTKVQSKSPSTAKSEHAPTQAKNGPTPKASPVSVQPAPKPMARIPYRPGALAVVKVHATSAYPSPNEADADEDALNVAAEAVSRKLAELDPPVAYHPSATEMKNEFVRRDTRLVRAPDASERAELEMYKIDTNRVYVEYDAEVTADQVRDLRTRDRVADVTRLLGVLTAAAIAGFLFLRLDEWTGGYLTRWLAIGALALASGAAVGLYLL
ncbi:MAG: hypothetical protein K8U57_17145 [Planctomycetes bacterium]|nr:hypothetical protein [Planctomycetota bacterium]